MHPITTCPIKVPCLMPCLVSVSAAPSVSSLFRSRRSHTGVPLLVAAMLLGCLTLVIDLPAQEAAAPPALPVVEAAEAPTIQYGRTIERVEYVGLKNVAEGKVREVMPLRAGQPYTREGEQSALRRIYALGFFKPDLRIEARPVAPDSNQVVVVVTLEENPLIEDITFVGNTLNTRALMRELPLRKGEVLPADARMQVERALSAYYRRRGYVALSIDLDVRELTPESVALTITVDEGRRVLVRDISFEGNRAFTSLRLGFHTSSKSTFLFIKNYFDAELFRADLEGVRDFYLSKGYLDAEVTAGEHRYNDDRSEVWLVIRVTEGRRYTLSEVNFAGHTLFTTPEMSQHFERVVGRPLDRERLNQAREAMRRMYGNSGWILMRDDPKFDADPETATVRMTLEVVEQQRMRVGDIRRTEAIQEVPLEELGAISRFFVKLAPPVKNEVVMRQMRLRSGEIYSAQAEERSLRNLRNLRVFREVAIKHEPGDREGVRNVNVETRVDNTGLLLIQGGVGADDGAFVSLRLTERNLFGEARAASIGASFGDRVQSLSISYLDRDIFETGNELNSRLFYTDSRRRGYDETQIGLTTELTRPLTDYLAESVRLRVADVAIDPDDDVEADLDDYLVAALRYGRSIDRRNDTRLPTRGYELGGFAEVGTADAFFVKFTGDFAWYRRLFADVVYGLDLRAGVMPTPSDRDDLGIGERFFLGGSNDVRGFRFRGAGPKDAGEADLALGGMTKLVARNEVFFPLGIPSMRGLVFLDAGVIDEDSFGWDSPRVSTGFGFRYNSNVVDAGLDFGFAIQKESDDDTQLIHFIIESGI